MINASSSDVPFQLQEGQPGDWRRAIDTSLTGPDDIQEDPSAAPSETAAVYTVRARSVVVLLRSMPASGRRSSIRKGL